MIVSVLLVNAIAILSEDRFLARSRPQLHSHHEPETNNTTVGWGSTQNEPAFGGGVQDSTSVKAKVINLINSVRTLMRSTCDIVTSQKQIQELTTLQYH